MQQSTRLLQLKANNELKANKAVEARRHFESIDASRATQKTILEAFKSLVAYLDNPQRVTKTSIVNQISSIGTPDALKVADAVKALHDTVKTHKNTDLSEIASLLKSVLKEVEQVPKNHNKIDIPSPVDNTRQLIDLAEAIKAVDKSIKEQKLIAEAPIVNVPETIVKVPKVDFTPIKEEQEKTRKEFIKAVKGIILPEFNIKPLESQLKKLNKLFDEFLDSVPSGSGGGGGIASYVDSNGIVNPVQKEPDGSIPVTVVSSSALKKTLIDKTTTTDVVYVGKADIGTATSSNAWLITKIDKSSSPVSITYADAGAFTAVWNDRADIGTVYS